MTVLTPVRKVFGHYLAVLFAMALVLPSLFLFCAVHKVFDKPKIALVTRVAVPVWHMVAIANTPKRPYDPNGYTTLVQQQAEQNTAAVAQYIRPKISPEYFAYNDDNYDGLSAFGAADPIGDFCSNIGQVLIHCLNNLPWQPVFVTSAFLCLWMAGPIVLRKF